MKPIKAIKAERWKVIPGIRDVYEVSDYGRIRSFLSNTGNRKTIPRILKPMIHKSGYRMVNIREKEDGLVKKKRMAPLILTAFIGPCPKGLEAAHWDGVKTNDKLSNLRWATKKENQHDKIRHGTHNRGERSGSAKLTEKDILEIRRRYVPFSRGPDNTVNMAREFGVTSQHLGNVIKRKKWSYI